MKDFPDLFPGPHLTAARRDRGHVSPQRDAEDANWREARVAGEDGNVDALPVRVVALFFTHDIRLRAQRGFVVSPLPPHHGQVRQPPGRNVHIREQHEAREARVGQRGARDGHARRGDPVGVVGADVAQTRVRRVGRAERRLEQVVTRAVRGAEPRGRVAHWAGPAEAREAAQAWARHAVQTPLFPPRFHPSEANVS